MKKEIFMKHITFVTEAYEASNSIADAIGTGEMNNGLEELLNDMGEFFADLMGITEDQEDVFYETFWSMVSDGYAEYSFQGVEAEFTSWSEFYDYFM